MSPGDPASRSAAACWAAGAAGQSKLLDATGLLGLSLLATATPTGQSEQVSGIYLCCARMLLASARASSNSSSTPRSA
eukprot:15457739-Alexandrium_andersonii.AAC.1